MTHSTTYDLVQPGAARPLLRRALPAATLLALTFGAAGAAAQPAPTEQDEVAAAALFRAGRELVAKGDYAAGCSRFEASMKLHATPSTMLNIARCHEHEGHLATAWLDYQRGLTLTRETPGPRRQKVLEKVAHEALAALEPRLPKLRIALASPPPELRVTCDGQELPVTTLDEALPGEPGDHVILATAPGFRDARVIVTLVEGQVAEVALMLQKDAPSSAAAPPPPVLASLPSLAPVEVPALVASPAPAPDGTGVRRVPSWVWVTASLGLAAGAGAAAFRVDKANLDGKQASLCHGDLQLGCPPRSVYDPSSDNARKDRDRELFIGLGVTSAVGLGAAIVGIVRAQIAKAKPPAAQATPWVGPGSAGAVVSGGF